MTPADTRLFLAARNGSLDEAQAAIDAGADVNARDEHGDTPLHHVAAYANNPNFVKLLIAHGANVNALNEHGSTPLHIIAYSDERTMARIATAKALIDAGAGLVPRDDFGATPLHLAANKGNAEIAQLLIESARDRTLNLRDVVNATNNHRHTPADNARQQGHTALALALDHFAQVAAAEKVRIGPHTAREHDRRQALLTNGPDVGL